MSLIGIDLGTSAIKVVAYAVDGTALAAARRAVPGLPPRAGPLGGGRPRVAGGVLVGAARGRGRPGVAGPAGAISFSSSGREVFPVAADGTPLGPCLMTADTRGDDVAAVTATRHSPEEWFRLTGHVPRRMDPVNRALWWRATDPTSPRGRAGS